LHVEDGPCLSLYRAVFSSALGGGFVDGRGAHQPLAVCELAAKLDPHGNKGISCAEATKVATEALKASAPRGPGLAALTEKIGALPPYVYSVPPAPTPDTYIAYARFVHLPSDQLLVSAAKTRDRWIITSFVWLPNE
jgi:hypothetical protein